MTPNISNRIARIGATGLVIAGMGFGLLTASASADGGKSCLWTVGELTSSATNGAVMNGSLTDPEGTLLWVDGAGGAGGVDFKCTDGKWVKVPAKPISRVSTVNPKLPTSLATPPTFQIDR